MDISLMFPFILVLGVLLALTSCDKLDKCLDQGVKLKLVEIK